MKWSKPALEVDAQLNQNSTLAAQLPILPERLPQQFTDAEVEALYRTHLRSNPGGKSLTASWISPFPGRKRFC